MDLAMIRLPELAAAINAVRLDPLPQLNDSNVNRESAIWASAGRLQAAIAAVKASAASAKAHSRADGFASSIQEPLAELSSAAAEAQVTLRDLALRLHTADVNGTEVTPEEISRTLDMLTAESNVSQTADELWRTTALELERLLEARIARFEQARMAIFAALALFLVIAAAMITLVARSIVQPQRKLTAAMRAISSGDLQHMVPYRRASNELGEVARAVEVFREAMVERHMLEKDLSAERDDLDARVAQRTRDLAAANAGAEKRRRMLEYALQTLKAGLWLNSARTKQFWSSAKVEEIVGKPMRTEDMASGVWDIVVEEDRPFVLEQARRFVKSGVDQQLEIRIRRADGEIRWVSMTAARMSADLTVGLIFDITHRKNSELALERAREQAETANRAKSAFLANMSHEIRTPLNGVLGMAHALERTAMSDKQREMLSVITESGSLLLGILNDLLDAAKIEAGKLELEPSPFNLREAVNSVAALYSGLAAPKGLRVSVNVEGAPDRAILADPLRLRQILQNFMNNAVKFTERGGIAIHVRTLVEDAEKARLRIEVRDTGIGMSEETRQRLFARFAQADGSITRRFGGTGLGLSIARDLAQLMGGEVGCHSIEGEGSIFFVEFDAAFADSSASSPQTSPDRDDITAHGLRILAADDNATNRLVLKTLLDQIGLEADFAEDGQLALEMASARPYDLILMDVHMPRMDGREATRNIRAQAGPNAHIPIIALTADVAPDHIEACRAAGMSAHVGKPIQPAQLLAAISAAVAEVQAESPDQPARASA
jgi:PAS domain S-box-containing protein